MGSASWNVSSGPSAWRTRAWRRPRPSSCLSRFWIDMCIISIRRTSRYATPPPQWLHERILTSLATGHNQIPQRPDRTHPRQPGGEPAGLGVGGGEPEALFADARDDQGQGVRGDCFDAKVNEGRQRGAGSWKLSGGQPASCRRCRRRGITLFCFCQSGMHRYVDITFRRQRPVGMLRVFFVQSRPDRILDDNALIAIRAWTAE